MMRRIFDLGRRLVPIGSKDDPLVLAAIISQIAALDPAAVFADATFPDHSLHWWPVANARLFAPMGGLDLDPFYARFHADTTHAPVPKLGVRAATPVVRSGHGWIYVGDAEAAHRCLPVAAEGAALIFRRAGSAAPVLGNSLPDFAQLSLGDSVYAALVPPRGRHQGLPASRGRALPRIAIRSAEALPRQIQLTPAALIHDSEHQSESNDEVAWLWTGPDALTRFALGRIPPRFAIVVSLMPSDRHRDLATSVSFQINGEPAPYRFEPNGTTAGHYVIPVPALAGGGIILGVAYRFHSAAGLRQLGVCISSISIVPDSK